MARYLHCGACKRAFDATVTPSCPACGQSRAAAPSVAAAVEQLAAAVAAAGPDERAALVAGLARALGVTPAPAERSVLPVPAPRPAPTPSRITVLRPIVDGLVARLTRGVRALARAVA